MNKSQIHLMHSEPIWKALIKLGMPTMIGMLISALYNVVDAYYVSGLGTSAMGAVSISFPIGQIIIGLGIVFGGGAASYISRLIGENKMDRANQVASSALFAGTVLGMLTIAGSLYFINPILTLFGATDTILPYARDYAFIFIAGSILNIFTVTASNIITSEGVTRYAMISMAVGGILNVILDPIMIYNFNLGIKGAAIATLISSFASFLLYMRYIYLKKGILVMSIRHIRFELGLYIEVLKVGIPIFIFQLLASLAIAFTNSAASQYGDSAVAAMGIVTRLIAMGNYIIYGFLRGFQPFAGYNYGAHQYSRLQAAIKTIIQWTSLFALSAAVIMLVLSGQIIGIFSNDPSVIGLGSYALKINAIALIPYGFQMTYAVLFLALGKMKEGGIFTLTRQGLFFIPTILFLPMLFGIDGVIYAQLIADALTTILCLYFAYKMRLEFTRLIPEMI